MRPWLTRAGRRAALRGPAARAGRRHRPRGPAQSWWCATAGCAARARCCNCTTARARASGSWCCPPRTGAIAGGWLCSSLPALHLEAGRGVAPAAHAGEREQLRAGGAGRAARRPVTLAGGGRDHGGRGRRAWPRPCSRSSRPSTWAACSSALDPLVKDGRCSGLDVRAALDELDARRRAAGRAGRARAVGAAHGRGRALQWPSRSRARRPRRWRGGCGRSRWAAPEELRTALDAAVADGVLDDVQRDVVLRNALDPGDAQIEGGTAPFSYESRGVFAIEAAASRNLPNGKEQARARVREIVSPGMGGRERPAASTASATCSRPARAARAAGRPSRSARCARRAARGRRRPARQSRAARPPTGSRRPTPRRARRTAPARCSTDGRARRFEGAGSWAAPAPVRSALPDTLHFDEVAAGLAGQRAARAGTRAARRCSCRPIRCGPRWPTSRACWAASRWSSGSSCTTSTSRPCCSTRGLSEVEDRVLIAMQDRQLVLRVDDTSIKDFEAKMPRRPRAAGGRDPLRLRRRAAAPRGRALPRAGHHRRRARPRPGAASWTACRAATARSPRRSPRTCLASIGRGRRACRATRVETQGQGGEHGRLPRARRAARRRGDHGVHRQGGRGLPRALGGRGGSFGGRGRRGTLALDHPASELVELVGWTRPLASTQASRGNGTLGSGLGKWAVAELDPTRARRRDHDELHARRRGRAPSLDHHRHRPDGDQRTLPVRAGDGLGRWTSDTFSVGRRLRASSSATTAATSSQARASRRSARRDRPRSTMSATTDGGVLGGAEVMRYTGFDGSQLTGRARATRPASRAARGRPALRPHDPESAIDSVQGGSTSLDGRARVRDHLRRGAHRRHPGPAA